MMHPMRTLGRGLAALLVLAGGLLQAPAELEAQARSQAQPQSQLKLQLPADEITYPRGDVFIQNLDRIWTAGGEVLEHASILIQGGIIRAVGPDLEPPAGVRVVNGVGRTAMPGIVDEHSHTAMIGTNEGTAPIVPEVTVLDAVNPGDYGIFRALSGGVTTARLMHGSSNPIGGQSAVIKMRWGMEEARQMLVPGAPRAVKFALGENVTRKASQGGGGFGGQQNLRFPASRQGVEALYVQAFTAAEAYRQVWRDYEADPAAFGAPPRRDLRLEALVDIMEDRILIHAHSYRSDEILMLMRVAERFGFRIDAFTHILEGYRVADELREHGAGASTFSDWWQFKLEAYDAIPHNAALLAERGVLTALNSDISWLQTFMNWEIAKPVQYGGASQEEALRMLTLNPAIMLGIESMVGSLEVGKHGDVVLLTGDPFDSFSRVEKTFIEGVLYFDSEDEEGTRGEPFLPLPATPASRHVASDASRPAPSGLGGSAAAPVSGAASEAPPLNPRAEPVALVGGTIHPVTSAPVEDGVLLLEGGRIQAMGPRGTVAIPEGVRQVDVTGRHLYPGMIDPVTHLGLFEFGQVSQATDRTETGRFNPHIRALGAYQPHGRAPFVARARGITSVLTAQTGGVIQGMGSVVNLEGDTFERAGIRSEGALMVNLPLPTNPPGQTTSWDLFGDHHGHGREVVWAGQVLFGGGHLHAGGELAWDQYDGRAWASDMAGGPRGEHFLDLSAQQFRGRGGAGQAQGSREASLSNGQLQELADYMRRALEFVEGGETVAQRPDAPFEANVWGGDRVALEAMAPVMRGEIPVFFRADSDWQIRHVFLLADEFPDIRPVIVGGVHAFRVAEELAERQIPVILTRTRSPTPDRDDSYAASFRNAAILEAAGVTFAFATDESADVRNLPEHVAVAISHGLPVEAGFEAVTIRAARILGLEEVMGSLEPGKRADLLVTDGHPLQALTRIETMFIGGMEVDPRDNHHDREYERFRNRR
jgi:imidazolonepropionase-like amidohydrolase